MIVHPAVLADFPANSHAFEDLVLENQVAGVTAFGEKAIFFQRFRLHPMRHDVVLHILQREIALGDSGKAFDPVVDSEPVDRCLLTGLLMLADP